MKFDPVVSDEVNRGIADLKVREEEALVERAAKQYGVPYVNLALSSINTDALRLITEEDAHQGNIVAFDIHGHNVRVAVQSIDNPHAVEIINTLRRQEYNVEVCLGSAKSLEKAYGRYADLSLTTRSHGSFVDVSADAIDEITRRVKNNNDVRVVFQEFMSDEEEQARTTKLIELIMGAAVATKTSDVHIEPQEDAVRVRYRQDGILEDVLSLDTEVYRSLSNRFKVLSGLKINITKDAQDGRFTISFQGIEIEVRVSTIPGPYGEGIVMRLLDPRNIAVEFEDLGIDPFLLDIFKREIAKPNGIILTTGPTGSGKTTTLYTFLKHVYNPGIKAITIEDPIEYHLAGIQQTQVDTAKGYDFLSGLRAAMRQDPEVIMVGEIRDKETAITAVQAAQTGHLVFSTLHTNNAAGVIPRLLALDVNPSLMASTLRLMIAQRLCRRLYEPSRVPHILTPQEEKIIRAIIARAERNGKDMKTRYGITSDMSITLYDAAPHPDAPSGFKGRVGLFEAITMDRSIEELLEHNPTERQLRDASHAQGVLTLAEDAIVKVLQGVTSLAEVTTVVDLEQDLDDQPIDLPPHKDIPLVREGVTETSQISPSSTTGAELQLLVNYLKHLEAQSREHPSAAISAEIATTEDTILEVLKQHSITGLAISADPTERALQELHTVARDIDALVANPHVFTDPTKVADLETIRKSLEGLMN